ncbi:MAG TPA: Fe-S cluster assembly protein IscX [Terriglobales bacterium]
MPGTLTWDDAEKIGILLSRKHPQLYPLAADLKDLHGYVIHLPEFGGDPKIFETSKLEAIRAAWNTEFLDRTQ